jgi:uncharacterized protein YdgA (DUF945 family)
MLKRILLSVLAIACLICVLAPAVMGMVFKRQYLALISTVNEEHQVHIVVQRYEDGWLHSHVVLEVSPVYGVQHSAAINFSMNQLMALGTVVLDQRITHGPLVFDAIKNAYSLSAAAIQQSVYLSSQIQALIYGKVDHQSTLTINSQIDVHGRWSNQLFMPFLTIPVSDVGVIKWEGLNGSIYFTVKHNEIINANSQLTVGNLRLVSNSQASLGAQINVQPIALVSTADKQPIGLWNSATNAYLSRLLIKGDLSTYLDLQDFKLAYSGVVNGETYGSSFEMKLQKLLIPSFDISELSRINVSLTVNQVSALGLKNLMNYAKIQTLAATNRQAFLKQYDAYLLATLTPLTAVNFNVSLDTSLGAVNSDINVGLLPGVAMPATLDALDKVITLQVNMQIAIPLARKLAELGYAYYSALLPAPAPSAVVGVADTQKAPALVNPVDQLVQSGYLIQQANDYVMAITFNQGQLMLNGKALAVP